MSASYRDFLEAKAQSFASGGFSPTWMPGALFDFQASLLVQLEPRGYQVCAESLLFPIDGGDAVRVERDQAVTA